MMGIPNAVKAARLAPASSAYWRGRYDEERARLAKLWAMYQNALRERDALRARLDGPRDAPVVVEPVVVDERTPKAPPQDLPKPPHRHGDYTLHTRTVRLKNGGERRIYFFAKKIPKTGTPCPLPDGYEVRVQKRSGLPVLALGGKAAATEAKKYRPQCSALTASSLQCRNSARQNSKYCGSHKGYRPPSRKKVLGSLDTAPKDAKAVDTLPLVAGSGPGGHAPHPAGSTQQCAGLTHAGLQCRRDARKNSAYCIQHKGRRPATWTSVLEGRTTRPRVHGAKDTRPAVRAQRRRGG